MKEEKKEKSLILEVIENEEGVAVKFGSTGFNKFEIVGILQMQINQVFSDITENKKVFLDNSNIKTQA